ncbi:hypothetical protein Tco_0447986 [Tanacetum coccineum]
MEPALTAEGTGCCKKVKDITFSKMDVIKNEAHFIEKVVNNDLSESYGGKGGSCGSNGGRGGSMAGRCGGRTSRESKNACGEVGGVKKISSMGSKFMIKGEECLEGCVCASGKEVKGGGDDFRVSKSLLGEIPGVVIGKSSGETFGDNRGAV